MSKHASLTPLTRKAVKESTKKVRELLASTQEHVLKPDELAQIVNECFNQLLDLVRESKKIAELADRHAVEQIESQNGEVIALLKDIAGLLRATEPLKVEVLTKLKDRLDSL